MDEYFLKRMDRGPLLSLPGNYLLFEFPVMDAPGNTHEVIFEMQTRGYKPVLAHPERYRYFFNSIELARKLKELGVFFQLNIMSLTGQYGKGPRMLAGEFLKKGWYDFCCNGLASANPIGQPCKSIASNSGI